MADDVGIPYSTYPTDPPCRAGRDEIEADGTLVDYDGDGILGEEDVFWTGSNTGSSGSSKKKENADERLERLMLRKLPSVSRVQLLCHLSRKKKRAIFAGRNDGVVVYWKPTSARNHDSFELKEYHFVGRYITCEVFYE